MTCIHGVDLDGACNGCADIVSQVVRVHEDGSFHHFNCDRFQPGPQLGPSTKPCNCRVVGR